MDNMCIGYILDRRFSNTRAIMRAKKTG